MTAKLSVTLAARAGRALRELAEQHGVNQSVITEAALMYFSDLSFADRFRLIRATSASKKAYTRGRWRASFWNAIFDEFWFPLELRSGRRSDFTPLTFAGFQIWILTDSIANLDREDAPFAIVAAANAMSTHVSPDTKREFTFRRDASPYDAAQTVVAFIRECVAPSRTLEIVDLPGGARVQLDHAGPHWMALPATQPLRLPIAVTTPRGSFILEDRHILRRPIPE
jgi:hypothetical protein